jgi:hypothetical protein
MDAALESDVMNFLNWLKAACKDCMRRNTSRCDICPSSTACQLVSRATAQPPEPLDMDNTHDATKHRRACYIRQMELTQAPMQAREFACIHNCTPDARAMTLHNMAKAGEIKQRKVGKSVYYALSETVLDTLQT